MSDVTPMSEISGLSFDSILLPRLLFFCLGPLLSLSSPSSARWLILVTFFPEKVLIFFFVKRQAFLFVSCLAARRTKLVSVMCCMLPHGTSIFC